MLIFKFLHIVSMFLAVGLAVGTELLLHRVANSGDVRAIRTTFALVKPIGIAIPVMFVIGLIFGLITAATGQLNFLAPWLVLAYVVFGLTFVVTGIAGGWPAKVAKAAAASSEEAPSVELTVLVHQGFPRFSMYFSLVAVVVLVFLMVVKPFGN